MKRKIGKIIVIIIILFLAFIGSYVITNYVDGINKSKKEANIEVVFDDHDYYVIPNTNVLTEEDALLEWPYKFTIKNTGNSKGIYQIKISDHSENDINRDSLSYILYLDEKEIKKDTLKNIKNDVLYEGSINKNTEQKYKLYIYKNSENEGKVYQYSIKINALLEGGPGF